MKKRGGVPYLAIFGRFLDFENFYKCLTFLGGKKHFFFKKCPNNGLVSEKKYIEKFFIVGGGSDPSMKNFILFFSFFFEGFPNKRYSSSIFISLNR